jgi:hypothetical protein
MSHHPQGSREGSQHQLCDQRLLDHHRIIDLFDHLSTLVVASSFRPTGNKSRLDGEGARGTLS